MPHGRYWYCKCNNALGPVNDIMYTRAASLTVPISAMWHLRLGNNYHIKLFFTMMVSSIIIETLRHCIRSMISECPNYYSLHNYCTPTENCTIAVQLAKL